MAIGQSNDSELNEDLALGPGKRLREVRIARNLEVEDIAARLRLHVRTIKSIEADDYEHLPAPTFVRGYLSGYARLLDLPRGPIVESYERNDFAPPMLVPDISKREEIKSTDFPVRLVTYAIAGILIIFVTIWWQSQQSPRVSDQGSDTSFASQTFDAVPDTPTSEVDGLAIDQIDETTPQGGAPSSVTTGNNVDTNVESALSDSLNEAHAQTTVDLEENSVQDATPVETVPVASDDSDVSPALEDDTAITQPEPGELGVNRLKMFFSHESWVEIYAEDGKKLFYNLARAGVTIDISEAGAIRVVLGYPEGVKIEFNGKPFDQGPHTTAGIARFTLDASANTPSIAESQFPLQSSQQQ